jgi:hypothetical protein
MQAWLRRCRNQTRVIRGRQDHDSVFAMQGDTLGAMLLSFPHNLAEMSFSILKLPDPERAVADLARHRGLTAIRGRLLHG